MWSCAKDHHLRNFAVTRKRNAFANKNAAETTTGSVTTIALACIGSFIYFFAEQTVIGVRRIVGSGGSAPDFPRRRVALMECRLNMPATFGPLLHRKSAYQAA